jgi:predicted transcriptional regulator
MQIETYETLCQLDVYKDLYALDKVIYGIIEKYHCVYGSPEWIYKSVKELSKVSGTSTSSVSRSKKRLLYYGLIQVKKHYSHNGNRGIDWIHLNTLDEVYEHLKKDVANSKDLNRLKPRICGSSLKPDMCGSQ